MITVNDDLSGSKERESRLLEENSFLKKQLDTMNRTVETMTLLLKNSNSDEEKLELSIEINKLKSEIDVWKVKVAELEKRLNTSDGEIAKEVQRILATQGIDEALAYMESIDFEKEKAKNRERAEALLIQADLYNLKNNHQKAMKAYRDSIGFSRNFSNSLAFVHYLSQQNEHTQALKELQIMQLLLRFTQDEKIVFLGTLANRYSYLNELEKAQKAYDEALEIYRGLAKINPSAYKPYVATTLNNLANLYGARNELEKAQKAYDEALEIRRGLAKINPSAYEIALARSIIVGVYSVKQPKENLNEAETILKRYDGVYMAEQLLGVIKQLRKEE